MIRQIFQRYQAVPNSFTVKELFQRYDVFYVCFDEPDRARNWQQIQSLVPTAKKVEGVVGFDKALKTCAQQSATSHFFVIDGDNQIVAEQLDQLYEFEKVEKDWVLSWASLNPLNGLAYGNGGLKLWPKKVALKIKSHEQADKSEDQTDYCFIAKYFLIDDYVTQTLMNGTHQQAFRAGLREGVKMSLAWGKQVPLNKDNFAQILGEQNRRRLKIWCEVGKDSIHGCWAIVGARLGLILNTIERFDYKNINSYDWIDQYLEDKVLKPLDISHSQIENLVWNQKALDHFNKELATRINKELPLNIKEISPIESLRFKKEFKNPCRQGLLKPQEPQST